MGSRHAAMGRFPKARVTAMNPAMIDLAFDISGGTLPTTYPFALWAELVRHMPRLADNESVGVLPLRAAENDGEVLLPKRAKLVLRTPSTLSEEMMANLTGQRLDLGGIPMQLGTGKTRPLTPHPTVHAQQVASTEDEVPFMESVRAQLDEMGIACNLICGMRRTIGVKELSIHGYSLVVHGLKPEASLLLQSNGLGKGRCFGCGIFLPYKVISGLE